jgi:hypothetical protein
VRASSSVPSLAAWDAADRAAFAMNAHPETAGLSAIRAAYESTGNVDTASLDGTRQLVWATAGKIG